MYIFIPQELKERKSRENLSLRGLAKKTKLDFKTIQKALHGKPVNENSALAILDALGDDLSLVELKRGNRIDIDSIERGNRFDISKKRN